jgi:peroxiredoxin
MILKKNIMMMGALLLAFTSAPALAAVEIGQMAPEIETVDVNGEAFKLSDHKGKTIVLEWTNHQCPFVVKHYGTGNMQATQKEALALGDVEWISIVSSADGKQGNVTPEEANAILSEAGAAPSAKILDASGAIGNAYGALTTPHMFVINAEGTLVYAGAIDDNSSPNPKTVEGATNYVLAALADVKAGNAVAIPQTQPYGCSVKY